MYRITFLTPLIFILIAVNSCTKKSASGNTTTNGNGYYLRFNLDGVPKTYAANDYASFLFNKGDSLYNGFLFGYKDLNTGVANEIEISIMNSSPIQATSYHDPMKASEANGSVVPVVTLFYFDSLANGFLTLGAEADQNGHVPIQGAVANAQLTITEINSTSIKGTFSGTVFKSTDQTFQQKHSITDGTFYLKRID